jgi:hypothetical protein
MNPKLKAIEIHHSFLTQQNTLDYDVAKECAIVCVEQIIKYIRSKNDNKDLAYWQEVKTQMNNI